MNLEEAIQLINWLDEEHRKDKAQITELQGQLSLQYTQISGLNKNLQDLEERVARLQTQSLRYSQIEQAIGQSKTEAQIMIEQYEKHRVQAEEDSFKIRQLEREREDQIHSSLQMQIEAIQGFQRSIIGDHELLTRLDLMLVTLQRELEEGIRRDEGYDQRLQILEEWVPRFGQLASEQRALSERLRQERAEAAEAARRAEQQRARHMAEWAEQMKASRREIDDWIAEMRGIKEQHKEDRKIYPQLQELEDRLKPLEPRLMQWQRLLEETRHKEREQLVSDMDKRWQQQMGEWQFLRDEWTKRLSAISERIGKLEDWRPEVLTAIHEFVEKVDKERRDRIAMVIEVGKTLTEMERQRNAGIGKLADDLLVRLEGDKAASKPKQRAPKVTAEA
jgi:chromosome segregation ATPase